MFDIKKRAEELSQFIIERRRYYHQHPELSGEEVQTTAAIKADLEAMGIEPVLFKSHPGLTAIIHGNGEGKTVALRADIDALNTIEKTGLPFAAKNGKMHACGHDTHIAMQLGAAKILMENRNKFNGNVKLIFQSAEEPALGALWAIDEGALDGVDAIYGTHIWGNFDAPLIDISSGKRMSTNCWFRIVLKGQTAHGSAPNLGKDASTAAAAVINNLQMVVSRFNDPRNPLVISIGTIRGGTSWNSIPAEVELIGCARHYRSDDWVEKQMRQVISGTAAAMGVDYSFEFEERTLPIINNHEDLNNIARQAVTEMYGESALGHLPTLMSSEDFSWFMNQVPGVFTYIGASNRELGITATNHEDTFDIDESVLQRGAALAAAFAIKYLNN